MTVVRRKKKSQELRRRLSYSSKWKKLISISIVTGIVISTCIVLVQLNKSHSNVDKFKFVSTVEEKIIENGTDTKPIFQIEEIDEKTSSINSTVTKPKPDIENKDEHERCISLETLPQEEIANIDKLDLSGCGIEFISENIKYATNLKQLDVSNNPSLQDLPSELINCKNLDILFASYCPSMKEMPTVLGQMESITRLGWRSGSLTSINAESLPPNLVHLILTNNHIERIEDPQVFEKLKNVRKLMLSHNQIDKFGSDDVATVEKLQKLELIRLAGNNLTSVPRALWSLPKLAWLTLSGNPMIQEKYSTHTKVSSITMEDLEPTRTYLGEGASGQVQSYIWENTEVAVKIIHGVTSDGRAEDELKIYSAIGSEGMEHRVVGCIALLQDEKQGVVMQRLPNDLKDLAMPPTIQEVTLDRWHQHTSLSRSFIFNTLTDILTALKFLHQNSIAHGDVYAHNIKVDMESGRAYLLDFGASYFTGNHALEAMKLEVRSFGVLVEGMLSKLDHLESNLSLGLRELLNLCMNDNVDERPSWDTLQDVLETLS